MKIYLASVTLLLAAISVLFAQTLPTFEEQLTILWKQNNYGELRTLLDSKTSAVPPDVVALYCSKFFYVFIQPNKTKALSSVTMLRSVAQATKDADFISFANGELVEVQGIPDAEFSQPNTEILTALHSEFAEQYPNLSMGARLRKYIKP